MSAPTDPLDLAAASAPQGRITEPGCGCGGLVVTAFIGDVHGWRDRLEQLLARLDPAEDLVFLGDLIDRGPESAAVIALVRRLCDSGRARCVMGNHEYALVRGLGCPALGIAPTTVLFEAWCQTYGGEATCSSYGVEPFRPEDLTRALGDDLDFLARLPWLIEGGTEGRRWYAVHAGLRDQPLRPQLAELRDPSPWWLPGAPLPPVLYSKERIIQLPVDLPSGYTVISGHTPLAEVLRERHRIVCDTSGGQPGRVLSAVTWPALQIVQSDAST